MSEAETISRTLQLLKERGRYERLVSVAASEPPRVRALLGALGAVDWWAVRREGSEKRVPRRDSRERN